MKSMNNSNEMLKAVHTLITLFRRFVKHGFFCFTVTGEKKNGRTIVSIQAGESYRFNIRENEIDVINPDSWDGSRDEQ